MYADGWNFHFGAGNDLSDFCVVCDTVSVLIGLVSFFMVDMCSLDDLLSSSLD